MIVRKALKKVGMGILIPAVAGIFFLVTMSFAAVGNFTVPCNEVKPQNGLFVFPAKPFDDGKCDRDGHIYNRIAFERLHYKY